MSFHRLVMSVALAGGLACTAPYTAARGPVGASVAAVEVEGVDVEQVAALGVGVPLNFTVFGTPGSLVSLRIDGGGRVLELREAEPGVYEASYVIDGRDSIRPDSRVTASLQKNGAVAYSTLDEPLLLAQGTVPWNVAAVPSPAPAPTPIPVPALGRPASPVLTSASTVPAPAPVPPSIAAPRPMPVPIAVTAQPVPPATFAAAAPRRERSPCGDCAVVESVRAVDAPPRGGVIGAIGGAIAGAILGKEAGAAHTRRVLTVLGALGGALAGREIERQATRSTQYDVDLRLADGTVLKRRYEQAPPFAAGETIRLGAPPGRGGPAPASF